MQEAPANPSDQLQSLLPVPPPWRLIGQALVLLQTVPLERARLLVPAGLTLIAVAPGKTMGALYVAKYVAGSTLSYHELIVVPALVRQGLRLGGWISHIYVNDSRSAAAGYQYWALPKELATFQWFSEQRDQVILIQQGQSTLCQIQAKPTRGQLRLPLWAPAFSQREGRFLRFSARGWAKCGLGRATVELPPTSPFAALGFGRGKEVFLDQFDVLISPPRG